MKTYVHTKTCVVVAVQSLSCVWLFLTPWTAGHQASLSLTISQSFPKYMNVNSSIIHNYPEMEITQMSITQINCGTAIEQNIIQK